MCSRSENTSLYYIEARRLAKERQLQMFVGIEVYLTIILRISPGNMRNREDCCGRSDIFSVVICGLLKEDDVVGGGKVWEIRGGKFISSSV